MSGDQISQKTAQWIKDVKFVNVTSKSLCRITKFNYFLSSSQITRSCFKYCFLMLLLRGQVLFRESYPKTVLPLSAAWFDWSNKFRLPRHIIWDRYIEKWEFVSCGHEWKLFPSVKNTKTGPNFDRNKRLKEHATTRTVEHSMLQHNYTSSIGGTTTMNWEWGVDKLTVDRDKELVLIKGYVNLHRSEYRKEFHQ